MNMHIEYYLKILAKINELVAYGVKDRSFKRMYKRIIRKIKKEE